MNKRTQAGVFRRRLHRATTPADPVDENGDASGHATILGSVARAEKAVISKTVAQLGPLLRPSLALLAHAVETPDVAQWVNAEHAPLDAQGVCKAANQAQQAFTSALGRLQPEGGESIDCDSSELQAAAAQCLTACQMLVDVDVQARRLVQASGGSHATVTLALACRDSVVLAAHLLADLIRVLCDPDAARVLVGGQPGADGQTVLEFTATLRMPENVSELAGWMPLRVAWRHGDVQTSLRISALRPTPMEHHLRQAEALATTPDPAPPADQKVGFWHLLGLGLLFSWIGHVLWGHDHDGGD